MATEIDALQIEISAKAQKANQSIDALVSRLDVLSKSLGKINTGSANLLALGRGVDYLSRGMQGFKGVGEAKFVKLANGINQLANINSQGINNAARALSHIAASFDRVAGMQGNTAQVADLAKSLGRLGGVNVQRAIANIPQLATAMNNLMTTLSRSPMVSQNVIQMTNALANLAGQGSRVGSASNSISRSLNNTSSSATRAKKSFGGLASAIGKFYATYFLIVRAIKGLGRSIESTADYVEAFNYFNVALGKIGSDWSHEYEKYGYSSAEAYADSFSTRLRERLSSLSGLQVSLSADGSGLLTETGLKNLGLNIQEVTRYASQLASVTNSVGQTGEVSLAAASAFTKLGADISSLFNLDYSQVMQNLQSGLIGQSRALYRYGIDITNATLQTYAYELGLSKAVSEMTQAEKMQLRMIAILDQSKVSWGDLANTINSPSNLMRQFKNNLSEVGIVLGQLFIPLMQKAMPVINGMTIAIKRLLINIANLMGINLDLDAFGQGFSDMEDGAEDFADGLDDATDSAKKLNRQLGKFDELNNLTSSSGISGSLGDLSDTIDLTEEIIKATEEYEKAWAKALAEMESKAQQLAEHIGKIFAPIADPFQRFLQHLSLGGWTQAGEYAGDVITGIFDTASTALENVDWEKLGENIVKFLNGINWTEILKAAGNFLATLFNSALKLLFGGVGEADLGTLIFGGTIATASIFKMFSGIKGAGALAGSPIFKFGRTAGHVIIAGIASAFVGWNLGQFLYEQITGEEIELSFGEQIKGVFSSFKDGSWKEAFKLWGKDIGDGLKLMLDNSTIYQSDLGARLANWLRIQTNDFSTYQQVLGLKLAEWFNSQEYLFAKWGQKLGTEFREFIGSVVSDAQSLLDKFWEESVFKKDNDGRNHKGFNNEDFINRVQGYSTGGFPEDGLFMANHNELVGGFTNGRTAVANNGQIVEGIEGGVERAVSRVLAPYLVQIAQNTRETADKEFGITERQIYDANRNQENIYKKRTGK